MLIPRPARRSSLRAARGLDCAVGIVGRAPGEERAVVARGLGPRVPGDRAPRRGYGGLPDGRAPREGRAGRPPRRAPRLPSGSAPRRGSSRLPRRRDRCPSALRKARGGRLDLSVSRGDETAPGSGSRPAHGAVGLESRRRLTGAGPLTKAGGVAVGGAKTSGRSQRVSERAPIPTTITKVPRIRH